MIIKSINLNYQYQQIVDKNKWNQKNYTGYRELFISNVCAYSNILYRILNVFSTYLFS